MVASLKDKWDLLQRVYNQGGIVFLQFNKKKGSRAKMPDVSDYKIKGFRESGSSVHMIVCPVTNPGRIFSIDGKTMSTGVLCGSKRIAF